MLRSAIRLPNTSSDPPPSLSEIAFVDMKLVLLRRLEPWGCGRLNAIGVKQQGRIATDLKTRICFLLCDQKKGKPSSSFMIKLSKYTALHPVENIIL